MVINRHLFVGNRQLTQTHKLPIQPLPIGTARRISFLQQIVVDQLARAGVHQQHLTGAQTVLFDNAVGRDIQHTDLRRENQRIVARNIVPRGAQAVAVKNRPDHVAVAEQDRGRPVPGLHHRCIILVKVPFGPADVLVVVPGLRNCNHHGQRQVHPAHEQKLQRVVKHGRVGALGVHNRQHLVHIALERIRG